jgi:cholestenol delta-isomerase
MEKVVTETLKHAPHPFYPLDAEVVGYLANEYSVPVLLGTFAVGCMVILSATSTLIGRNSPILSSGDRWAILWNVLSESRSTYGEGQTLTMCSWLDTPLLRRYIPPATLNSHCLSFAGYFAYNHASMAGRGDLFGEMWKEYAFSDSRYITRDAFVVCMEATTAVGTSPLLGTLFADQHWKILWGPLSYCVAWMIATKHPLRYPLQAVVTLGQLYGLELYYATSLFDHYVNGMTYFRPEPYYFWVYYFFMNFIWVVFPGSKTPLCNRSGKGSRADTG